jgi:hypothetical protein
VSDVNVTHSGTLAKTWVESANLLSPANQVKLYADQAPNVQIPPTFYRCSAAGCGVAPLAAPVLVNVTPVVYMYSWAKTGGQVASGCSAMHTDPDAVMIVPTGVCAPVVSSGDGQVSSMRATSTTANDFTVSTYIGVVDCAGTAAYVRNGTLGATCYSSMPSANGTAFPREAFGGLAARLPTPNTVLQCSSAGCRNASATIPAAGTEPAYIYMFGANTTECAAANVDPAYLFIIDTGVCVPTVDFVFRRVVSIRVTITASGLYTYESFAGVVDCSGAPTFASNGTLGDHCVLDKAYVPHRHSPHSVLTARI